MPPVILDRDFNGKNVGLVAPTRTTKLGSLALQISNLDRADPPDYNPRDYPRSPHFNNNVFQISMTPAMPRINVACAIEGFDPADSPILWRLQTRYVVGRYQKTNRSDSDPKYKSLVDTRTDEWTGEAHSRTFLLFGPDSNVTYDNQTDRVAGGDCILTIAAKPAGAPGWLQDYVHLRLGGTNPSESGVRDYIKSALGNRDPNLTHIADAVFAWENGFKQFDPSYRTGETFHGVKFDWPPDPANFPAVAFDFGIGLSQYTHWGQETTAICWDWPENLNAGINELLGDLRSAFEARSKWLDWAKRAWGSYNGGDPGGTGAYARRLADSADGQLISVGSLPPGLNYVAQTAPIAMKPSPPPARVWPVENPSDAPARRPGGSELATVDAIEHAPSASAKKRSKKRKP